MATVPKRRIRHFNTCISFMVNCNLQHYSGESGLTYFTQLFVIMLFQFITAATGMAAIGWYYEEYGCQDNKTIGNFWHFFGSELYTYPVTAFFDCRFHPDSSGNPDGIRRKMKVTTLEDRNRWFRKDLRLPLCPLNN